MLLDGTGIGWVRVGGEEWVAVRVPEDDADCASRGRPFVCVELNSCRLTRGFVRVKPQSKNPKYGTVEVITR